MRDKIAGAVGMAGFLMITGATGGLSQGNCSVTTYLQIVAAGVVMIAAAMLWYEYQCVKEERRRRRIRHRRASRYESDRCYR